MLSLPLFVKSIIREWRSGELTLLFIVLVIAVTCVSAMNHFTNSVQAQLEQGAVNMLGADAVLTSTTPIDSNWKQKADELGITTTTTLSFLSMVEGQEQLQLSQIKAVSSPYPLRGEVMIAHQLNDAQGASQTSVPEQGTVWLNPRLVPLLSTNVGKTITIGAGEFKVNGVIRDEPGQMGDWFSLSPRIIMNINDVEKTKIIQPGSVLTYALLMKGTKEKLNEMHHFLVNKLTRQQQWLDSKNNNISVTNTINRTLNYLNFGTLMSLVLAGVAISMASLRYCQRHLKQVALLRSFGATQAQIIRSYMSSIALLGIVACLLGAFIGYALQPLLVIWLEGLLPQVKPQFDFGPFILSITSGMLLLFCFSVGNIWQLKKISAMSLFRQQHLIWKNSTYITYGLALLLLGILAYYYTQSIVLTLTVLGGCLIFVGVALAGLWLLFASFFTTTVRIPLNWRFGFNNIARNFEDSAMQVIGIGLALACILSLMLLKNHLISDWQNKLPPQSANYFIFNVEPSQVSSLNNLLEHNAIKVQRFYPVLRGRLTAINHESVTKIFGNEVKNINALQRELNLSWSEQLPDDNLVAQGAWMVSDPDKPWVSVEQGVAGRLKLKLGDVLSFTIADRVVDVQVSSIRQVDWGSFKPNFFMLLKPGLLDDLPQTMITSFYLSPEKQNLLLEITRTYPNVSLIDIASTISKVQSILSSAANAITFISFFALLAGLIIVMLAILSLSGTKQQETQVLKILGMRRITLLWIRSSEAFLIGLYSGFLAILSAVLINVYLASSILESHFTIPWLLLVIVPFSTAFLVVVINVIIQGNQYQGRARQLAVNS
ncbi:FtsX-like permease family protein [uncultured Legionella sp.]|uniref:ABC transporter permease n=1 Tax=uncultured Legionella sp. TaxID=210934 RepID=UPI0026202B1C|nr:FtsX-like permease family protein [uncultured Legionella sp.]